MLMLSLLCLGRLSAGNGPHNYLLVYDPDDPTAPTIVNRYLKRRGLPVGNVFVYDFPHQYKLNRNQFIDFLAAVRAHMAARGVTNQINGVILVGLAPTTVDTNSMTTSLMVAPMVDDIADYNQHFDPSDANSALGFANRALKAAGQEPVEIRANRSFNGHKYWVASHLGYTGKQGVRTEEVLDLIVRSTNADGSHPNGRIYWACNDNVRSDMREPQIPNVTQDWDNAGIDYEVRGSYPEQYTRDNGHFFPQAGIRMPENARNIIGVIAGFPINGIFADLNNRYVPGAIGDHVTSYGGVMGRALFTEGQMPLSEWLRAGCVGTSGTIIEPYTKTSKFATGAVHSHYARGATMGEAFLQAVENPRQLLISGDPLCQPFADVPTVSITNLDQGETIRNTQWIGVSAQATSGIQTRQLAVDGDIIASSGGGFSLDTRRLSDGYHELRVIVQNKTAQRSQAFATIGVWVDNHGAAVSLSGDSQRRFGDLVRLSASARNIPDVERIEIQALGRVLATLPPEGGDCTIDSTALGWADHTAVQAVAISPSLGHVASRPKPVDMNLYSAAPESARVQNGIALVRVWNDATGSDFDWHSPNKQKPVTGRDALIFDNRNASISIPHVPSSAYGKAAVEFAWYFNVQQGGYYDFSCEGADSLHVTGQGVNFSGDMPMMTTSLRPGRYLMRARIRRVTSSSFFKIGARSATLWFHPSPENPERRLIDFAQITAEMAQASQAISDPPSGSG